jgi:hypothetical protein
MSKRIFSFIALVLGILPMMACATIMKGPDQKISFSSDPKGASITVYDASGMVVAEGVTPTIMPLKKGDGFFQAARYRIEFAALGYEKKEVWISGSLEGGWYVAGNFLVGGLLGWLIVDPLTGAMWNLRPETVNARLDKKLISNSPGSLHVVLASQVPPELMLEAEPIAIDL